MAPHKILACPQACTNTPAANEQPASTQLTVEPAMSLNDLPTELDKHILEHLHSLDLSRMICISRYYRGISEPLLYKSIYIASNHHDRIKKLLFTLLRRKDLQAAIRTFGWKRGHLFLNSPLPMAQHTQPIRV
jgi:hypothetical protein